MKVARFIPVVLATGILLTGWAHTAPFSLEKGERPSAWKAVGGNDLAWRFLGGALNSGNGDAEDYDNPSYFCQAEPGDFSRGDYAVEVTIRSFQQNGTFTLLARFQDPSNYYGLQYGDRSRMGRVRLVKLQDGDYRYEKMVGHGYGYDNVTIPDMRLEPVRLRLEVRGDQIRGLVNDEFEMLMEDEDFPTGTAGFGNFFYHFEVLDFEVTDLTPPTPTARPAPTTEAVPAWIEFRANFSEQEAQDLKTYLDSQRISDVEVVQEGERWIVRTGVFSSPAEAQVALDLLTGEGITGGQVVRAGEPTILPPSVAVGEGAALSLVVGEYTAQEDAALHLSSLQEAGFEEAKLLRDNTTGTYKVLVGEFTTERQAAEFAAKLSRSGFTTIGTIAIARRAPPAALPDVNELTDLLVRRVLQELGTGLADQKEVSEVLSKYSDLLQSIKDREQIIQDLELRVTEMADAQKREAEQRVEEEKKQLEGLLAEAQAHIERGELDDARFKCNRIHELDPGNVEADNLLTNIRRQELERTRAETRRQREEEIHARLEAAVTLHAQGNFNDARLQLNNILASAIREQELSNRTRQEIDQARQLLATVDEDLRRNEYDNLNRLAVEAGEKGHLNRQLEYLNEMLRLSPYDEALLARVVAVQEALNERAEIDQKPIRKFGFMLYGLIVFVVLLALSFVLSWVVYRRQEERAVREEAEVPQLTYEPAKDNFQEEEPVFLEDSVVLNFGEVLSPEAEKRVVREGESLEILARRAGAAVAEPPSPPESTAEEGPPAAEDQAPISPTEEEVPPQPAQVGAETQSPAESLDDLLSEDEQKTDMAPDFGDLDLLETTGTEEETPSVEEALEPLEPELSAPETTELEKEPATTRARPRKESPTAPPLPEPIEGNLLFKQGFDDLEAGSQPLNWERSGGILKVESGGYGGIGKCLRFQKTQGDNAYSHCRFPPIQNIFRMEFDLRCEADIEGQIQIFIEHDEKAEGLVQVTAANGGRELAIQGVTAESTAGEWRHVKFIINLDKQVINGFVDGRLVAYKVPLPKAPEEINSISIMGDASSSGSLLVDNIKIYRV